ncbi:MAG: DUF89 domain-containing protein [Candidatus Hermodarchaeota archaeon]
MNLEPECIGCLFNQVLRALKTANPRVSRKIIISTQKKLMDYLLKIDINDISAPIVGGFAYNLVAEVLDLTDPYSQLKEKYNQLALTYYDDIKNLVENSEDPLFEAIAAAALGNTIDFATQHNIDLINDIKHFSSENFKINDYNLFKISLEHVNKNKGHLLILGDNCGEIVFDKLLVETIKKYHPDLEIIVSVRSIPIINDATMEDAKLIGLTDIVKVIEASPIPGIQLSTATEEFKKYFYDKNGMILSKGQGNFETLFKTNIPDKDLYYLLKAKCNLMERIFKVKIGSLIFKKKTADF